jgi:hypothetical protein
MGDLIDRLSGIPSVKQFDQPGEPQAATLAHSLGDLEQSFRATLDELLPRLLDPQKTPAELNDVLLDIGEELRHVLYHIKDPRFFSYLIDDAGDTP